MKIHLVSALVLFASVSSFAAAAAAPRPEFAPRSVLVRKVPRGDNAEIVPGVTRMTVLRLMGANYRQLAPNVWTYQNYPLTNDTPATRGCDTLVLTFTREKLTEIKAVNSSALGLIVANLKLNSNSGQLAQK